MQTLRDAALQAMEALIQFKPMLVGPVYEGTADSNSPVRLHLFADHTGRGHIFPMLICISHGRNGIIR